MSSAIHFYFDFSSPYGYFGALKIEALAAKHQRPIFWHPILLGVIFKTTQSQPLTQIPFKGQYAIHDFERSAAFYDIPYRLPSQFPISTQHAARATLWINQNVNQAAAVQFVKAAYHAYFVDDKMIGEQEVVLNVAAQCGLNTAQIDALKSALGSQELKDQLKTEIEQAIANQVFGAPFVIVSGEAFWGVDRFDQLDAFLQKLA